MRIKTLEITNYRQYRGNHIIHFGLDPEKNINIIMGANGAGKSNILNAITWCLYGSEDHLDKYEGSKQPILNDAILDEMEAGDCNTVEILMNLVDNSGRNIRFTRFTEISKKKNRISISKRDFSGEIEINGNMKKISEPNFMRDRFLPKSISSFFFFDGERLDDFFRLRASQRVREAIDEVSQLSMLENSIERLGYTVRKMRSRVKSINPETENLQAKIDAIEGGRDAIKEELEKVKEGLATTTTSLDECKTKLKGASDEVVKQLEARQVSLKRRNEISHTEIEEYRQKQLDLIIGAGPFLLLAPALKFTLDLIQLKADAGELPPKIMRVFVEELLQKGRCICGTSLENSTTKTEVEKLLSDVRISELSHDLTGMRFQIQNTLDTLSQFERNLSILETKEENLAKVITKNEAELRDILTELKNIDSEEVADSAFQMDNLERQQNDYIRQHALLTSQMGNARLRIESLSKKLTKALKDDRKKNTESEKLALASEMLGILQKTYDHLIDTTRSQIEERTKEYFLRLIWKKNTYSNVMIGSDYQISVLNNYGHDCLGSLSAGEREVLALAFLAALREVSGFDAPILMDTPLGRISKEPKENVAKLLPDFFKTTQVTLLVTEEEYTSAVRKRLIDNIDKEYMLFYKDDVTGTKVVDYVE